MCVTMERQITTKGWQPRDGALTFRNACFMGLEGIVAKRRDRPNRSGRSPHWIKVKNPAAPTRCRRGGCAGTD